MTGLEYIVRARQAYDKGDFQTAIAYLKRYAAVRNVDALPGSDDRNQMTPAVSVIIVTNSMDDRLRACLKSLQEQSCKDYELIIVDNGVDRDAQDWFTNDSILHLRLPVNVGLSEGRNIGADCARGNILLFLDDDGIADSNLIEQTRAAFDEFDFLAVRGRVLAFDSNSRRNNKHPGNYDSGCYPLPAVLNTECVIAVRREIWMAASGMDPLMLHGEGEEFSRRILDQNPGKDIYYWPKMILYHDYGAGKKLYNKMKREEILKAYLAFKKSEASGIGLNYGRWYHQHPSGTIIVDNRSLLTRLLAQARTSILRFRIRRQAKRSLIKR
ncbi:GT2 family glycosyltransferase [Desulfobaculum xiamenense]|uniref:GT2 family glycosyltransferase n=1 Tax=Desulfobaculum xiamenense TaxID=995050 RepID=A0A846QQS0_9BACT|nr:glycosyltransferase [Desulfobaculum xiamenense]NJB67554.1 GT2 family glycosyltransferase [Desulfobaculum xiamenense]